MYVCMCVSALVIGTLSDPASAVRGVLGLEDIQAVRQLPTIVRACITRCRPRAPLTCFLAGVR
jgi:hypothetical protein